MSDSAALVRQLLESLGADPDDPRLAETPATVSDFLRPFAQPREPPRVSLYPVTTGAAVRLDGLPFYSLCEHHLLPFFGEATVAYLPGEHVAGFGGIQRVITHFATRLQLQERLTEEIVDYLEQTLSPRGIYVELRARQMCVEMTSGAPSTRVHTTVRRGDWPSDGAGR